MANVNVKMNNFELNGREYSVSPSGYFFKKYAGTTCRISKEEYNDAVARKEAEENPEVLNITDRKVIECEEGGSKVEFAIVNGVRAAKMLGDEDTEYAVVKVVSAVDAGGRYSSTFMFNGKRYWTQDAKSLKEAAKAKTPKKAKKAAAFEHGGVTLTEKQVDFLKRLPEECGGFWENGLESEVWLDVLVDHIGGQFAGKPMTVGAMISTLREKHLIDVEKAMDREGHPKFFCLTLQGQEVAKALGLK